MVFLYRQSACRLLLLIILCCSMQAGRCTAPKRILLLSGGATAPWALQMGDALRGELLRKHARAELHMEVFPPPVGAGVSLPPWLIAKYAGSSYEAVIALTPELLPIALALRDRLWPHAAVVASELEPGRATALAQVPRVTGLLMHNVVARNLQLMFDLLPDTRHIAIISVGIDHDSLRPTWRAELQPWLRRAQLIDLSNLETEVLLHRLRELPPRTAIYLAAPALPQSAVLTAYDLVRAAAPATHAPIFVDVSTLIGAGAVGGWVNSPVALAHDIASQVNRLLDGVPPSRIGFEPHSVPRLRFDWRAVRRAGIDVAALPPGSVLEFQPPGLWEAYRTAVLATALVLAVQSALIGALLLERRRRKRAERQTRQHLGELARLDRIGTVGALSAALAHEINQPLGAILSNAETAELLLESPHASHDELRELIGAIRADNQRAATVLVRLRAWIANSAGQPQRLALNPLLDEVARILRVEVHMRGAELRLQLDDRVPEVQADGVQIQQVTLNLVLNALDALQQVAPAQRRVSIHSARNAAGGADVCVSDNGPGLSGIAPERLFEPFFSTKPDGLGIGLSISRSIVERHGGTLRVEQPAGGGALFRFSLPAAEVAP